MLLNIPYKFKKSYGDTPELQIPQDAPWLHGFSLKIIKLRAVSSPDRNALRDEATTSGSVGSYGACMCGNSCMSRDDGFQAVRAACKKLQIRTL